MVEAFPANAAEKALADRVRPRRQEGRADYTGAYPGSHAVEDLAVFAVPVSKQEAQAAAVGRGIAELLRDPGVRGRPRPKQAFYSTRVEDTAEDVVTGYPGRWSFGQGTMGVEEGYPRQTRDEGE